MRSLRVLAVLILACSWAIPGLASHASAAAGPSNQDALHEVMPGDDLRLIAGYYFGDTRQWGRIWEANRDLIKNPNRIERGAYLRIPNAVVPAEPYADYVARTRAVAAAKAPTIVVPPVPPVAAASPEAATPPPAPTPAAPMAGPAPVPVAPAKAAPAKAAPTSPVPAPGKAAAPAATPPGAQPPAATPAPAPAKQAVAPPAPLAAKAPAPPAKGPTKAAPPPPPKEWYEELLSPEFFTSIEFMAGAGVLVLALVGFVLWRRKKAAEES